MNGFFILDKGANLDGPGLQGNINVNMIFASHVQLLSSTSILLGYHTTFIMINCFM